MQTILVVDDQKAARRLLGHALSDAYRVVEADDREAALRALRTDAIDLVILDLHMPPAVETADEGIRTHRAIADQAPAVPVVVTTGDQDRNVALDMIQRGVADFLLKPIDPEVLRIVVARTLERARLEGELRELRAAVRERYSFGNLIGQSRAMREVFAQLERLAQVNTTVLLLGESGSGKSAVARTLHHASPRTARPFVVVDGAAMPESLIESELFGHVRGAYTGAESPKQGRIRKADGGTLFLDEIGNLSLEVQGKLLLFLDNRTFTPVGSSEEARVDVRLIAATHRDLQEMVGKGEFREDLLFRLQVATVTLPPLAERIEDIAPLAEYLLASLEKEMAGRKVQLTPAAIELLESYPWPGNVRQLRHVLESSLVLAGGGTLDAGDLILPATPGSAGAADPAAGSFKERVAELERRMLVEAIESYHGNKTAAGRSLGLDKNQVLYLCRKHGLS